MAQLQIISSLPFSFAKMSFAHKRESSSLAMRSSKIPCATQQKASYKVYDNTQTIPRGSTVFQPSIWTYDYIQSLNPKYKEEVYIDQLRVLMEEVRIMFCKVESEFDQLEFIDVLQRLGVEYHYDSEIRNILDNIYKNYISNEEKNLDATALKFRLLRQHGYNISSDVFIPFKDEKGNFKICETNDVEGMLLSYEASFHSFENEIILDELKDFTSKILKEYSNKSKGCYTSLLINHALELPLRWRNPRWEAQWFIYAYEKKQNMIPALLQLAKLNFNISQAIYIKELKESSRWWNQSGLREKMSFARDRVVEAYIYAVGANSRPDLEYFRKNKTKMNALITAIDDVYDVYGTLEELKLFTEVIDRWDLKYAMDSLPDCMKACFLSLYNFVNEIASENQKKNGCNITPYLIKVWTDLCQAYLIEAKWYHSGYMPSLEEYLENAWISISAPVLIMNSYCLIPHSIKKEELDSLKIYPDIVRFSAMILRLANDLGTYKRESAMGDVPKSIECYMNEHGASEAEAREYLNTLIDQTWKKMNEAAHNSSFSRCFITTATNIANMALCIYHSGDGYSSQDPEINSIILSWIIQPIPVTQRNN